jgi:hypothetical protein
MLICLGCLIGSLPMGFRSSRTLLDNGGGRSETTWSSNIVLQEFTCRPLGARPEITKILAHAYAWLSAGLLPFSTFRSVTQS